MKILFFIVLILIALSMLINPDFFANLKYPPLAKKLKKSKAFKIFIRLWGGLWLLIGLVCIIIFIVNK